jgi:hypothetical protein
LFTTLSFDSNDIKDIPVILKRKSDFKETIGKTTRHNTTEERYNKKYKKTEYSISIKDGWDTIWANKKYRYCIDKEAYYLKGYYAKPKCDKT